MKDLTTKQIREAAAKCGIKFVSVYRQKRGIKLYAVRFRCLHCDGYMDPNNVQHRRLEKLTKLIPGYIVSLEKRKYGNVSSIILTPEIVK